MKGTLGREICIYDGCGSYVKAYGWCEKHWDRVKKNGDPDYVRRSPVERFWSNVTKTDTCWNYARLNAAGYGRIIVDGVRLQAHRFSYELHLGRIPDGLVLDHLCRNTACVNPDHLEPVTDAVNILRGISPFAENSRKEFCVNGHEYTPENTMVRKEGWRNCRTCNVERQRRAAMERKSA